MNPQQARIALTLVIPIVTLMVLSPALAVKAVTSGTNSATVGHGVATATSGNCTATVSHGKPSVVCTPACPPGMTGTTSTEDPEIDIPESAEVSGGDVAGSGSCFPNGEDESSDSNEVD